MCFKPIYMRDDLEGKKLNKAVGRLYELNQKKLTEVVITAPLPAVRKAAVGLCTNDRVIVDVAKRDKDTDVRLAAVEKIDDISVLADIMNSNINRDGAVCKAVSDKLGSLAANGSSENIRIAAVKVIKDQKILAKLAATSYYHSVRLAAIYQLTDRDALNKLLNNSGLLLNERDAAECSLNDLRLNEMKTSGDQDGIAKIAKTSSDWSFRYTAVKMLSDQSALADIAMSDVSESIRLAAVERLTDQTALAEVLKKEESSRVDLQAVTNIGVDNVIRMIDKDPSSYSRFGVVNSLCKLRKTWFCQLSPDSLKVVLEYIKLLNPATESMISSLIASYRAGCSGIRSYANNISVTEHSDKHQYGSWHVDAKNCDTDTHNDSIRELYHQDSGDMLINKL